MSIGLVMLVVFVLAYELALVVVTVAHERAHERAGGRRTRLGTGRSRPAGSFLDAPRELLASDRQRDEAAEVVGAALGEGRLGVDEAVSRIGRALRARRCAELQDLVADLLDPRRGGDVHPWPAGRRGCARSA